MLKALFDFEKDFLGKYIFLFVTFVTFVFSLIFILRVSASYSFAATKVATPVYLPSGKFSYSVWVPYWARWGGTDELLASSTTGGINYKSHFASTTLATSTFLAATSSNINLSQVNILSPFSFEVNETGAFLDKGKLGEDPFKTLLAVAKEKKIKIYPTVLWTNADQMEKVLNDTDLQQAILTDTLYYLKKYNLDGIDIDFEGKKASTKDEFSALLKLLSAGLHKNNKGLICTIEVRTPFTDKYSVLKTKTKNSIEYSNDYAVIGKYCDNVRLMTYDQMGDDTVLNNKNKDTLYRPVADINWVERVIKNTIAFGIPAKKIVLGVATYGYKFEVTPKANATTTNFNTPDKYGSILLNDQSTFKYSRIGSMNYFYADQLAKSLNILPERNSGGELQFSYSTSTGLSNPSPGTMKTYFVEYSDSEAIKQKITLAKKYSLAGIAIFKIDGNNDHNIWQNLK